MATYLSTLLSLLLAAILLISLAMFVVRGYIRNRRSRRFSRRIIAKGLRFSVDDPFDIFHRYQKFAVINGGHSPLAEQVASGRYCGWSVRAFNFHCEVGHGTRRLTRHYSIVVFEPEGELPDLLVWRRADSDQIPLEIKGGLQIGVWQATGDLHLAEKLCPILESSGFSGIAVQLKGNAAMFCVAQSAKMEIFFTDWIDGAKTVMDRIGTELKLSPPRTDVDVNE